MVTMLPSPLVPERKAGHPSAWRLELKTGRRREGKGQTEPGFRTGPSELPQCFRWVGESDMNTITKSDSHRKAVLMPDQGGDIFSGHSWVTERAFWLPWRGMCGRIFSWIKDVDKARGLQDHCSL